MTVQVANEIRPADTPIYCSACRGQDKTLTHIDFDAACDRGFGDGPLPVSMDDLILCENCVKNAGRLVGMEEASETSQERDKFKRLWHEEKALREQAVGYADRMEEALQHRPDKLKVSKPRGRPRVESVA